MVLDAIQRMNLTLSAGTAAVSLAFAPPAFAGSVLVGSLIEAFNFHGLRRSAQFLFDGQIAGRGGWVVVFALRFIVFATVVFGVMYFGAHPVGLVIGLSLVVPATLIDAWRRRPTIDEDAPALPFDDPDWELWDPWRARERYRDELEDDWP